MRIAYCTNVRLPSERAHGHQVAAVCDALVHLGHNVTIFAPYRKNVVAEDYWTYFGADRSVKLTHLGSFDPIDSKLLPGVAGLLALNVLLRRGLKKELSSSSFDQVYTRSPALLSALLDSGLPVILELHQLPRRGRNAFVKQCRACRIVSCLTSPMREVLITWGVPSHKVIVAGDAVDLNEFEAPTDSVATRRLYNVPANIPLIAYVGQLQSMGLSKGVPELLSALQILHEQHIDFRAVIAGGPESTRQEFIDSLSSELQSLITFTGHIDHAMVPALMHAADVLVYPAPASHHPFYLRDTSPLKLFEYMAAGRPIVAANLPPLHDAVDDSMVTFVEPGNGEDLARGIRWVLDHPTEAVVMAKKARAYVEEWTWEKRMKKILDAATINP